MHGVMVLNYYRFKRVAFEKLEYGLFVAFWITM